MLLRPPDFLQPLLRQPVAVFGAGVSGDGLRALLAAIGAEAVVYDAQPGKGAEFSAAAVRDHGLVVFSPGFAPEHPWLQRARAAGLECLGELDFASLFWRGRLLAITGTNGKTTLTEFLVHALRAAGHDAHAAGNIGHPLSQLAAGKRGGGRDAWTVCEVSSFQAETLKHLRPDATLWANFAEDHLERHGTLERYFDAKWALVERTTHAPAGVLVGSSVAQHARRFGRPLTAVTCVPTEAQPAEPRLQGTIFAAYPQYENFLLALAWWRANQMDEAGLFAAARSFQLGRHRLTCVAENAGVTFWNDSKATNFHAVEAALAGFEAPVVLIAGGKSKGGDLAGFVHRIASRVKHIVLLGETAAELAVHCAASRVAHSRAGTFTEAVQRAAEVAAPGEHVLLSPGFASFDMFLNYEDRGVQFEALVRAHAARDIATAPSLG